MSNQRQAMNQSLGESSDEDGSHEWQEDENEEEEEENEVEEVEASSGREEGPTLPGRAGGGQDVPPDPA